jgi:hypothetical protein
MMMLMSLSLAQLYQYCHQEVIPWIDKLGEWLRRILYRVCVSTCRLDSECGEGGWQKTDGKT